MYLDTDLGLESILGIYTALELEHNAWSTFIVLAVRRHS